MAMHCKKYLNNEIYFMFSKHLEESTHNPMMQNPKYFRSFSLHGYESDPPACFSTTVLFMSVFVAVPFNWGTEEV